MIRLSSLTDAFWNLVSHPGWGVLIALLAVAAVIDWRNGRIPNWLTLTGMAWGLAFNASQGASMTSGLGTGVLGLGTGLVLFLPLYAMRAMGAGDVKLMAMVGAFLGAGPTAVAALFVMIAGGVASLLHAATLGATGLLLANSLALAQGLLRHGRGSPPATPMRSLGRIRYGGCIALGTLAYLVLRQQAGS